MANDDWLENSSAGVDSTYSVDKFYTASRNKKGFCTSVRLAVPPETLAHIGEMVAQRVFPEYRTPADFFRDAIVHRLKYAETAAPNRVLSEESKRIREMLMVEAELDKLSALVEQNTRIAERARWILHHIDDGNREMAVVVLRDLLPQISDPRLREQLSREIN